MKFVDTIRLSGHFKMIKEYRDGREETVVDEHNLLLLSGRTAMRNLVAGSNMSLNYITRLAFGDNASTSDVNNPPAAASEEQAAQMNVLFTTPVTYSFPDDYKVTFLGIMDYEEGNGNYYNEYMLKNDAGNGITYKTTRSVPKTEDFRLRVYWTLKFDQPASP